MRLFLISPYGASLCAGTEPKLLRGHEPDHRSYALQVQTASRCSINFSACEPRLRPFPARH